MIYNSQNRLFGHRSVNNLPIMTIVIYLKSFAEWKNRFYPTSGFQLRPSVFLLTFWQISENIEAQIVWITN